MLTYSCDTTLVPQSYHLDTQMVSGGVENVLLQGCPVWRGAVLRRRWPPFPCQGAARCGLSLVTGGVAGAGAGLHRMPRGQWRPAIGGRPHRRPPRRRASPAPFFLADCGGLSVWVGFLSDVISGVESAVWEGCYPALTLAPTCEANRAS
jgi:hypothetical protein